MTSARLTTAIRISALVRRVNAEGGSAMVLKKGDPTAGAILLILCERSLDSRLFERALDDKGEYRWRQIGMNLAGEPQKVAEFLEKRRRNDHELRSDERRVGTECVRTGRTRGERKQ